MNAYRYLAARADGSTVRGVRFAPDATFLEGELVRGGLHPLELAPARAPRGRSVDRRELATVFRSLATLVHAGVPLHRALLATADVPRHAALREALRHARQQLTAGLSLSSALARPDGPIPEVVLGMLRAGERGSQLAPALEQAASQLEREAELAARIRQALAYPTVLMVAGLASTGVITLVVVPRFAALLADLGQSIPVTTRLLLATGQLLRAHGVVLSALVAAVAAMGSAWCRTPYGRLHRDALLLQLPVLGAMRQGFATARLTRAAGAMLETGVPVLTALRAAADAAGDAEIARRLERAQRRVEAGSRVTEAFTAERVVLPAALQLLHVGESGGRLGTMALRAGDLAASEAEGRLRLIVSLLEPSLVIGFGGLVAFTAAALLQAVYSLRPG